MVNRPDTALFADACRQGPVRVRSFRARLVGAPLHSGFPFQSPGPAACSSAITGACRPHTRWRAVRLRTSPGKRTRANPSTFGNRLVCGGSRGTHRRRLDGGEPRQGIHSTRERPCPSRRPRTRRRPWNGNRGRIAICRAVFALLFDPKTCDRRGGCVQSKSTFVHPIPRCANLLKPNRLHPVLRARVRATRKVTESLIVGSL